MIDKIDISKAELQEKNAYLERKVSEQSNELLHANNELEVFCAAVSHDLRTPIRAIQIFTNQLKKKFGDDIELTTTTYLGNIQQCAEEMNEMINSLVVFSRVGQQTPTKANVDMTLVVAHAISSVAGAACNEVDITVDTLPNTKADTALIKNVWTNLISNAVKYRKLDEPCRIHISGEVRDGMAIYKITDNGISFDMRYYDKLFLPFSRLHSTSVYKGAGTGLAISQRIIKKHGGDIWAQSRINEGSTFWFSLPIAVDL